MDYTVTFVGDDYCYGDGVHEMVMPSGGFTYGWSSCCWVTLTTDAGNTVPGGNMIQIATVNDLANNSPVFKHPPLWLIMAGCDGQFIDLAPQDIDNDRIACRWATPVEAGGAFTDLSVWPSLSLDAESCTVHYSGSMDGTNVGVKPVSLMIEDFDIDGNVRSSVPVQFLARVWTPNLQSRTLSYPDWFATDADDHHDEYTKRETKQAHKKVARVGRSVPAYCNAVPVFTGATPNDGDVLDASSGSLSFTVTAKSQLENGSIDFFSYQAPLGLICTQAQSVVSAASTHCNWKLSDVQLNGQTYPFCFDATDSAGLKTERRCIQIKTTTPIRNIWDCAIAVLDSPTATEGFFRTDNITNYGCAGRGLFDAFSVTEGKQLDTADKAFYAWKKCYQCATGVHASLVTDYDYNLENDSCGEFF